MVRQQVRIGINGQEAVLLFRPGTPCPEYNTTILDFPDCSPGPDCYDGETTLARIGNKAEVGLGCFPAIRVFFPGFIIRHGRHNYYIISLVPVYRSRDLMLSR